MFMGDLLAAARRSASRIEGWLAEADPDLSARLAGAAARDGIGQATWLRVAIADFDRYADEEDWATLVSHLRNDDDPGRRCLLTMLEWRLDMAGAPPAIRSTSGEETSDERDTEASRS